jgi:protein SCO1/2
VASPTTRRRLIAVLALVLGVTLAGCGGSAGSSLAGVQTVDNGGWNGSYLDPPFIVPPVPLTDTTGKSFTLSTSTAPLKIVFYGYTHCPDICQIMMSTISSALARVGADRSKVQVVFITTDPARDTGPAMRTYLDRFGDGYVGLGGSIATIGKLAAPMKVFIGQGRKLADGGYEVDHSTYVFGVTGDRVRVIWSQGTSPAEMAADVVKLLKA